MPSTPSFRRRGTVASEDGPRRRRRHTVLPGATTFVSGAVVAGALLVGCQARRVHAGNPPAASVTPDDAVASTDGASPDAASPAAAEPWGHLVTHPIVVEAPDSFFGPQNCNPAQPVWQFPGFRADGLKALFDEAGLSDADRDAFLAAARCDDKGCSLQPSSARVAALSPGARSTLYTRLAELPGNPQQTFAFRRRPREMRRWYHAAELPDEVQDLIRRYAYRDGDFVAFADMPLVCGRLGSWQERLRVLRAITREPALLVSVRVTPASDIDAIAAYWEKGKRSKGIRSLLESVRRLAGGADVDLIHLLPSFARARLYAFPDPDDPRFDCFWTALNFFNPDPDNRYLDSRNIAAAIRSDYVPVEGEREFGDLLLFQDAGGRVIHAANWIADGIVFTKNGASPRKPWVLMRFDDLDAIYAATTRVQVMRLRHPPGP